MPSIFYCMKMDGCVHVLCLTQDDVAAIHTAALGGSVECVRLAAKYGANLNAVTKVS